jgi:uncharacterized membrane protein YqjE
MIEEQVCAEERIYTRSQTNGVGLFGSLRRLGETALSILQNRLELVAVELREEKSRAISVLVWGAAVIFLGIMFFVVGTFTVAFWFWDNPDLVRKILLGFTGFYLIGAIAAFLMVKSKIKHPLPFNETISQLKKDRAWLASRK